MLKKDKQFLLIWGLLVVGLALVILGIGLINKKNNSKENEEEKIKIENSYAFKIKYNDVVKIEFQESYDSCSAKICSDIKTNVTKIVFNNAKDKKLFKDILINREVDEVINELNNLYYSSLKKNDILDVNVTTNWINYEKYELEAKTTSEIISTHVTYIKDLEEKSEFTEMMPVIYISNISSSSATASWDEISGAQGYEVNTNNEESYEPKKTLVNISALEANMPFTIKVKAYKEVDGKKVYTKEASKTFTTLK